MHQIERMTWRLYRGKALTYFMDLSDMALTIQHSHFCLCVRGAIVLLQCIQGCELSNIPDIKALRPCSKRGHSASDRSVKFTILREILSCRGLYE